MQSLVVRCSLLPLTDQLINQRTPMSDTPQFNLKKLNPAFDGKKPSSFSGFSTWRAKVAGGWLVIVIGSSGSSVTFYPDPNHTWDGGTLP